MTIKRVVLDVLKPHEPSLPSLTGDLLEQLDVDGITATLVEIDEEVRTIRVVMEGEDLDLEQIESVIGELGASIHSIDQISVGDTIVADRPIRQR